jgi:hypothetical protein
VSKQSLQNAKGKYSHSDENSGISFLIEIFRLLYALSTPFHTPNVAHANCSVKTFPADRITQTFKFRRQLCYFFPDWDISDLYALSPPFYPPNVAHANCSVKTFPADRITQTFKFRRQLCYFFPDWDISDLYALSTPFYTPNVAHANFIVQTIPANRKAQTFKFRRHFCYFFPDWDISEFKRSFPSILHAECSTRQFDRPNNPCKSQSANFQISTTFLLFLSWLRYFGV